MRCTNGLSLQSCMQDMCAKGPIIPYAVFEMFDLAEHVPHPTKKKYLNIFWSYNSQSKFNFYIYMQ